MKPKYRKGAKVQKSKKEKKCLLAKHIQMEKKALKQALKDDKNGIWNEKDQLIVMSAHTYGR